MPTQPLAQAMDFPSERDPSLRPVTVTPHVMFPATRSFCTPGLSARFASFQTSQPGDPGALPRHWEKAETPKFSSMAGLLLANELRLRAFELSGHVALRADVAVLDALRILLQVQQVLRRRVHRLPRGPQADYGLELGRPEQGHVARRGDPQSLLLGGEAGRAHGVVAVVRPTGAAAVGVLLLPEGALGEAGAGLLVVLPRSAARGATLAEGDDLEGAGVQDALHRLAADGDLAEVLEVLQVFQLLPGRLPRAGSGLVAQQRPSAPQREGARQEGGRERGEPASAHGAPPSRVVQ
mmetsp:Transcript_87631/g.272334  ORF Transcript_87631/g.272334 Transcript_87631/m.272334 type:complete len:295 (+) Transcript_87631:59-943(+)